MTQRAIPVVRLFFACEEIRIDSHSQTVYIKNPLSTIGVPTQAMGGPLRELWLYSQLADGLGSYQLSVQLRRFDSDVILGRSDPVPIVFSLEDRLKVHEAVFRLRNLRLNLPGSFEFILFANHVELARTQLQMR